MDSSILHQKLFELSPDGILLIDPETQRVVEFNDAACRQLGYTREEFSGLQISDYEALQTAEEIGAHVQQALRDGHIEFDTRQRTKLGELRDVHVWARTVTLGGREYFYAIFRDTTALRLAERGLRSSNELLNLTGQVAKIGGWVLDIQTQSLTWSEEVYHIHEVDPATRPTVDDAIQFYAPEARAVISAAVQAAVDHGTPFDLELPLMTARGRHLWVRALGVSERRAGNAIRLFGAFQDITWRRRRDESMRLQSVALNAAANAVVITDRSGAIQWTNPAFTRLTGYSEQEAVGRNPRDLSSSGQHDRAFFQRFWDTILAGKVWRGETINRRKDGRLYTEAQVVTPVTNASGAITNFIAIKEDITEHLELQAQLRQAQKMEAVGLLAGGIAHDFNNVLTAILGYSELLLVRLESDPALAADLKEIRDAGERAGRLTRQLLAFSRKQSLVPQVLDLNEAVKDIEKMLRRVLRESIEVRLEPCGDVWLTKADPGQVEQILLNLAVNARDAMPSGGMLTIRTANVTFDAGFLRRHPGTIAGDYISLAIEDTGTGIPPELLSRVFDPFFTTKPTGHGTGLGLATVHGIVKQSGGHVTIDSEVGVGTVVTVFLPRATGVAARASTAVSPTSGRGHETVLIAEDQGDVRGLMGRILREHGYRVLEARDGVEASAVSAAHHAPIHLLLSDVIMPGLNGPDLAQRMLAPRPDLRVLYVSGFASHFAVHLGTLGTRSGFLQKPFTPEGLTAKVREVLDAPPEGVALT